MLEGVRSVVQPQPDEYDPTSPTGYAEPQQPFMQQPMMQAQMQPMQQQMMAQQYAQQQQMLAQQYAQQQHMMYQQPRLSRVGWSVPRLSNAGILGIIILVLCIAGLIMDASGTPWIWSDDVNGGENYDGDEIRADMYGYIDDDDTPPPPSRMLNWPSTMMILGIIFAVPLLVIDLVPMPVRLQGGLHGLFLLANGTCSLFMMMSFAEWMGFYISDMFTPGDMDSHLNVMIYWFAAVGIAMSVSFMMFEGKLEQASGGWQTGEFQLPMAKIISNMMLCAVLALVFTPLFPLAYQSYSDEYKDNPWYDKEEDGNGHPISPADIDTLYWQVDRMDELGVGNSWDEVESENEAIYDVMVNKARLHDYFLAIFWVQISFLVLLLGISIPGLQKVMESICQLNILMIGLLIPITIFVIFLYVAIPNLLGDYASESVYDSVSFHMNWFLPLAAVLAIINWFVFLVTIHIPWWKQIQAKNYNQLWADTAASTVGQMQQPMMQQPMMQQVAQPQQVVQHQQPPQQQAFQQMARHPPQ